MLTEWIMERSWWQDGKWKGRWPSSAHAPRERRQPAVLTSALPTPRPCAAAMTSGTPLLLPWPPLCRCCSPLPPPPFCHFKYVLYFKKKETHRLLLFLSIYIYNPS